jgi:hypothetical protein
MDTTFNINQSSRNTITSILDNHTLDQLNTIPEGFSNNLIWNIGHIIVVQQMLVYKLSGLPMMVPEEMVDKYKRGSKPEHSVTQEEVDEFKKLLWSTVEQTKKDFTNGIFKNFTEFTTMTGYTMKTAKEAMEFNNYHEAIHTGIMMQIRKFI